MDENQEAAIGMIGLGTMGRNLALNMAEHGWHVAGYDIDPHKAESLRQEARPLKVTTATNLKEFVDILATPRVIMLMVPAGAPLDSAMRNLLEYAQPGDIIIDGGNTHFRDTEQRQKTLGERGINFLGFGISGGESGARHGPCIMPGGPRKPWEHVRPIFESVAARVGGDPCVAWMGPGGAGHYVKMVHNGIEYGLMQLIAESYDIMKRGLQMSDDEMHAVYADWTQSAIGGFLIEITAEIFLKQDPLTGRRLVDVIRDVASQKGTGIWTTMEAMELRVPAPTIDIAVAMRDLSAFGEERAAASRLLRGPGDHFERNRGAWITRLRGALEVAMLLTYGQGLKLLREASHHYNYGIDLETVSRIWRGGCIIRSALLDKISAALHTQPDVPLLMLEPGLCEEVSRHQGDLRTTACGAAEIGIPVPGFMASLAYYDAWRSAWLPRQPDPGPARLLRRPHLRTHRPRRRLSYAVE